MFILGEILSATDSLNRVLAQYDRLVRQDHLMKDDNVLSIVDDIPSPPPPKSSASQTLIDLAGSFSPANQTNSATNELDELFGSIKVNVPIASNQSGNVDHLDDCLPLFPTVNTNTNTNKPGSTSTNESTVPKKGGLFDDLQDLLVDQSTGQKISSTKR